MRSFALAALFVLTGCQHGLLDRQQASQAGAARKILKTNLPGIYSSIAQSGKAGALVSFGGGGAKLRVIPADDPVGAVEASSFAASNTCFYVHRHEANIAPEQLSCQRLSTDAETRRATREDIAQLREDAIEFSKRMNQLDESTRAKFASTETNLAKLRKAITAYDASLLTAMRLGVINADSVRIHSRALSALFSSAKLTKSQLGELNSSLVKLVAEYEANTKKLNETIAKLPK